MWKTEEGARTGAQAKLWQHSNDLRSHAARLITLRTVFFSSCSPCKPCLDSDGSFPMYQMHSLKAFLVQLPKLCCKAQTGLEDGESAIGGAAPEGLVGLKSLLPLARTRKQPLTRAAVLLAFHGGREGAREESKGSLPYILGSPLSKKLPAAFFFFHHCHFT